MSDHYELSDTSQTENGLGAVETALTTCEAVRELRHNSGPLVPSVEEWRRSSWLREKWPVMCDGET